MGTGGVAVYYNDNGGGENPLNQAYLRAQFSYANTNVKWNTNAKANDNTIYL